MRGETLYMLGQVWGEDPPDQPHTDVTPTDTVPDFARMHRDHVTVLESRFWQITWDAWRDQHEIERQADAAKRDKALAELRQRSGLKITRTSQAGRIVRPGNVYLVHVDEEGVSITEGSDPIEYSEILNGASTQPSRAP